MPYVRARAVLFGACISWMLASCTILDRLSRDPEPISPDASTDASAPTDAPNPPPVDAPTTPKEDAFVDRVRIDASTERDAGADTSDSSVDAGTDSADAGEDG